MERARHVSSRIGRRKEIKVLCRVGRKILDDSSSSKDVTIGEEKERDRGKEGEWRLEDFRKFRVEKERRRIVGSEETREEAEKQREEEAK